MATLKRILIVGGGIGGLSTAAALRIAGFEPPVVFERSPELREAGAGVGIWSASMVSLDQLGAGAAVRQSCLPIRVLAEASAAGKILTQIDMRELGPDFATAACYIVLRPVLLAALAACVPRSSVRVNSCAVRIEPAGERVRLYLEDGSDEEGDLLIGADGLHSVVRPLVVGEDRIRYSGQTCFRGVASMRVAEPGIIREVHGAGQRCSVCPVDGNTAYWWTALNGPHGTVVPQESRKSFLEERFKDWPFGIVDAIRATADGAILQNDLVDRPPARNYFKGNIVLIGDAAHPATPNLGQGANMAIDDAIVLARCLRDSPSIPEALGRYEQERLQRTRLIVERSWNFGRMCLWKSPAAVALRETMIRLTPRSVLRNMLRWQILESVGRL